MKEIALRILQPKDIVEAQVRPCCAHLLRQEDILLDKVQYTLIDGFFSDSNWQVLLQDQINQFKMRLTSFVIPLPKAIKAIFFDMDATLIVEESLVELAKIVGIEKEVDEITTKAMNGEIDFKVALESRIALLKGLDIQKILQLETRLSLQPGAKELIQKAHTKKVLLYLVTGGFHEFADPIARSLGFKEVCANNFEISGTVLSGRTSGKIIDGLGKMAFVKAKTKSLGLSSFEFAVIGDGANDQAMMQSSAFRFGYYPKASLWGALNGGVFQGNHLIISKMLFDL